MNRTKLAFFSGCWPSFCLFWIACPVNSKTWLTWKWFTEGKKGIDSSVGSPEPKALLVPLINKFSTTDYVPPTVEIGFELSVLLDRSWYDIPIMSWRDRWFFFRLNDSVGTQSCPNPPGRSAGCSEPTRLLYVRVLDSTCYILSHEAAILNLFHCPGLLQYVIADELCFSTKLSAVFGNGPRGRLQFSSLQKSYSASQGRET